MGTEKVDSSTRAIRLSMGNLYFNTKELKEAGLKWEKAEAYARKFEERFKDSRDMPAAVVKYRRDVGAQIIGNYEYDIETRGTRHYIVVKKVR